MVEHYHPKTLHFNQIDYINLLLHPTFEFNEKSRSQNI